MGRSTLLEILRITSLPLACAPTVIPEFSGGDGERLMSCSLLLQQGNYLHTPHMLISKMSDPTRINSLSFSSFGAE